MTSRKPSTFRSTTLALTASVMAAIPGLALAGPLTDAATKAEALAAAGNAVGAHDVMRTAISDFSASLPFSIAKALFITGEPAGYAMYEPRSSSNFKPGEPILSYVEPIGLGWKPAGTPDKIESRFTVDFDIRDAKGEILAQQKAFGDFTFTGFVRNPEIYATLTIDVSGAPPGDYIQRFHFNDQNGGKTASVDQPFTIAGP